MRYNIHEIFEFVEKEKNAQERVAILKKNDSKVLRDLLKMNFDPAIKFDLPEGSPPYKTDKNIPVGMGESNIFVEARRLYIFMPEKVLSSMKKEMLFIEMLEGLHYLEAEMLIAVKDKCLQKKYKGLSEKVVRDAFPDLLPPPPEKASKN